MDDRAYYRKLIRDKVPENMRAKGVAFETRVLDDEEFRTMLLKKVEEEASALPASKDKNELVSELADVLAVIEEIKKHEGITQEEIDAALEKAFAKKGGFDDRIFLEWSSSSDNYQTNEKKN